MKVSDLVNAIFPEVEADQTRGKAPPDGLEDLRADMRVLTRAAELRVPHFTAFGKVLGRRCGEIWGGLKLVGEVGRTRAVEWSVVTLGAPTVGPVAGR